jgi:CPA2 family monovalent cation:H+ antiporter-2
VTAFVREREAVSGSRLAGLARPAGRSGCAFAMETVPHLDELAVVAALAVAVTVLLSRLLLPTVAGLLAAGALLGPYGLHLTKSVESIEQLAEVGVVLLLFSIGLEFSLARLKNILQQVALGGILQVGATTAVVTAIAVGLGQEVGASLFYGFVFALSSTAIVLRALAERRELDAPHGRIIVGTLIFQDLCVVPMVLIVPLLGPGAAADSIALSTGIALGKAGLVVVGTIAISRFVVPKVLDWVDASRSREVFLLAILGLCIGTAWLTSLAGLSLALGAFLGGMVVADTQYGHRAMGDILPLRDAFVSVFFVSLGMLFDVRVVARQPLLVFGLLAGFLLAKGLLATLAAMAMRFPSRVAWLAGVGLAQFGEFGFVLTRLAEENGVVGHQAVQPLLAAGILSMFLTPLLVRVAPHITAGERLLAPLERLIGVRAIDETDEVTAGVRDHVLIVGYGLAGSLCAQALSASDVPHLVLELNADNVRRGKELGLAVYYGDATSEEALRHAHIERARLLVLLMNDAQACERVVATARRVAPDIRILVRTRYLSERERLIGLGAHRVVSEEVEGAVEMLHRMLRSVEVPRNVIEERIRAARLGSLESDRKQTVPRLRLGEVRDLDHLRIESALVLAECAARGRSARELALHTRTGALVVGVRRGEHLLDQADSSAPFELGDVVYFVGTSSALTAALRLFEAPGALATVPPLLDQSDPGSLAK